METISFKVDDATAKEIERCMRQAHYVTKTEFVRQAVRDRLRIERDVAHLNSVYGASKRRTTDKQLHEARELAFEEISRQLS